MVPFAASAEDTTETETHSAAESFLEKIADIYQNGDRPNEGTFYDETPFMTAMPPAPGAVAMAAMVECCIFSPPCSQMNTVYSTTNRQKKKYAAQKGRAAPKDCTPRCV